MSARMGLHYRVCVSEQAQESSERDQLWASLRALRPEIDRLAAGQFDSSDRQRQIMTAHKTIGAGPNAPTLIVLCASCYSALTTRDSSAFKFSLSIRNKLDSCGSMAVRFDSSANRAASKSWKIASICCASVLRGEDAAEDGVIETVA